MHQFFYIHVKVLQYLCRNNLFLVNATFPKSSNFFMVVVKNYHVKLIRAHFYTSRKPGDDLLIDRGGISLGISRRKESSHHRFILCPIKSTTT